MKDLSIIFEDNIEIKVQIATGNEVHDLVFKFSQPDDIQTLRVLQSIENPQELEAIGEKYSGDNVRINYRSTHVRYK